MGRHGLDKQRMERLHNARLITLLIACMCVCGAFVAGFFIRGDQALLEDLGFTSFVVAGAENPGETVTGSTYNSISARIAEVEGVLQNESLDSYDLDRSTTETLTAFAQSTEDDYLRYYTPERYAEYVVENSGKYSGVGVLFSESKGHAYVVDVFPGSVAESAGIKEGDFIVSIDADRSQDWSLAETINAFARDAGDSVVVTWRRPASFDAEGGDEFTTTLVCSEYSEVNVVSELHDGVGYIAIKQLTQNSAALTEKAIKDLTAQGARAFVLDIRDNPGGYLTQAVEIVSFFVKSGVVVGIQTKEENSSTKLATGNVITDRPLILLVNKNTAAAAEVIAAAIKDVNRGTLVGQTTLGKGSVQVVKPLSFGGALRYTAAYYKSPLGHEINNLGVVPGILVDQNSDTAMDNQKSLALETAQSMVEAV